jgi:N-acetylmuramoyl-L-alanine amidase
MGQLIIAGVGFDIDAPVRNWHETGFDATQERCLNPSTPCSENGTIPYGQKTIQKFARRYALRPQLRKYGMNPPLDAVKALLNQFIFHHDGCADSKMCWEVLHNERGLSCHFMVDNDGTIFQTIDLAFMAYHAAEYNIPSIGVELSNRGETKIRDYYSKHGQKREITTCRINGSKIETFDFTPAQMISMRALCQALTRLLPNIPIEYPQEAPGVQSWNTLPDAFSYKGYMGHYHCTARKWDPGPFNFKDFCEKLRGQRCFPLWTKKTEPAPGERPLVPSNGDDLKDGLKSLYAMNEEKAEGGYFPVGPWGETKIWHGGVHLAAKEKTSIWAPFPGRVVAARMTKATSFGSVNFVLMRHDMTVGAASMRFYSLYMHVLDETKELDPSKSPPWTKKDGWQKVLGRAKLDTKQRELVWDDTVSVGMLDEPIEAGELIARVGKAGPDNKGQIHFEIFSEQQLLAKLQGVKFEAIEGSTSGRFLDDPGVLGQMDSDPKDNKLSRRELVTFFANPGVRDQFRLFATHHISEWTADPDWAESLKSENEFRDTKPAEIDAMVADQITPGLWWTLKVAHHAKIPVDGLVWHFNPIDFIGVINQQISDAAVAESKKPPDTGAATGPKAGVVDDINDEEGLSAVVIAKGPTQDPDEDLKLEDIVQGFGG